MTNDIQEFIDVLRSIPKSAQKEVLDHARALAAAPKQDETPADACRRVVRIIDNATDDLHASRINLITCHARVARMYTEYECDGDAGLAESMAWLALAAEEAAHDLEQAIDSARKIALKVARQDD